MASRFDSLKGPRSSAQSFRQRLPRTTALLDAARADVFPDFAVGVSLRGESHFAFAGCGPESLFDLASLTKVIGTTTLMAIAEQKRVLSVDDPVKKYFPAFAPPGSERVRLSHLLNHTSGFPWWLPLHALFHAENGLGDFDPRQTPAIARARYETEILESWNAEQFEKQPAYSDLGFMLLGWALEKATGLPLDALFQEWVVQPTGLATLQYLPISPDVVPTENCPWRGHVLRGEVHDDNCFVLGGVAGHAGLFGNVIDVVEAGRLWLAAYTNDSTIAREELLATGTVRKFWTYSHVAGTTRVLGWDGVSRGEQGPSSSGKYFSDLARGHLGFTGTSLWIDPQRELIVSLLTNRVHPSRTNEKIKTFRPQFHDSLLEELGLESR